MTRLQDPSAPDVTERNAMILEHYPLVQRIAYRTASSLGTPTGVDAADLTSHGVLGLVEAWERYDPSRGVSFEIYAVPRIKGAIVDAIRNADWVPRKIRARARRINEATTALAGELGRSPTPDELRDQVGRDLDGRLPAALVGLDGPLNSEGVRDSVADLDAEVPGAAFEEAELRKLLAGYLNRLPERDRLILTLYYFEGVPLAEIAAALGVTESRVSQIHTRALQTLRGRLADVA